MKKHSLVMGTLAGMTFFTPALPHAQEPEGKLKAQAPQVQARTPKAVSRTPGRGQYAGLQLSEEQQEKLKVIQQEEREGMAKLRPQMANAQLEGRRLARAETIDKQAIEAAVERVAELQGQLFRLRVDSELKLRAMLTPEQLEMWTRSLRRSYGPSRPVAPPVKPASPPEG